jgi:hypothetical protein
MHFECKERPLTNTAEFINSMNNSISGLYVLSNHRMLTQGTACTINGWVGQWSVQVSHNRALSF